MRVALLLSARLMVCVFIELFTMLPLSARAEAVSYPADPELALSVKAPAVELKVMLATELTVALAILFVAVAVLLPTK